jgi:hypothetical protein
MTPGGPRSLVLVSVAIVSLGALLLSVEALREARMAARPMLSASPAAIESGDADLRREIEALRAEVAALRAQMENAELARRAAERSLAHLPAPEVGAVDGRGDAGRAMHSVHFVVPNPAVAVRESASGALSVTNQDPALTGKILIVKAVSEDGTEVSVPILIPAPGT